MTVRTHLIALQLALAAASPWALANSPYAGEETREIKALSADEVEGLLAGRGMGYAKAAELNGYPGPAHVLELAAQLSLTEAQLAQTRALHARMQREAQAAGRELVAAERELDALYRTQQATPERLSGTLAQVAARQAQVREAHLKAHIEQRALLSAQQVAQYQALRGYTGSAPSHPKGGHQGGHHGGHRHHGSH